MTVILTGLITIQKAAVSVSIAVTRPPSIRLGDCYFNRTYHYTEGLRQRAITKVTVILTRLLSSQLDLFCVVPQEWVLTVILTRLLLSLIHI